MIPVQRSRPPRGFQAKVLTPGRQWLARNKHASGRPPSYWLRVRDDLARAFQHRCGYSAMYEPVGTVDHYLSIEGGHRNLAYSWSNFRYAAAWVNSSKSTLDDQVLDPFEVGADWFEIDLPSLQLKLTDKVPARLRKKAALTIERLHLDHGEPVLRQRQAWYQKYQEGKATLTLLDDWAPLLAAAIRKRDGHGAAPKKRPRARAPKVARNVRPRRRSRPA